MKKLTILIAMLMAIGGCSKEVPVNQLVERGGVYYEVNSQTPFTGISVEYYLDTIIKNEFEERVLSKRTTFKNGIKNGLYESFHLNGQLKTKGNFIIKIMPPVQQILNYYKSNKHSYVFPIILHENLITN